MVAARSAAMGFNRLVDAALRRAEPAHRDARDAARRDDARAKRASSSLVSSAAVRLRRVEARADLLRCCRRSRWRSSSGTRWRSGSRPTRSCFSAWRWRWRRSAAGSRPADAAAVEPWLLGAAIGTWVGGFDVLYACQDLEFDRAARAAIDSGSLRRRALAGHLARDARHRRRCASLRSQRSRTSDGSTSPAWLASPCCSSTSSRWSASTICRRSSARSISTATSASCTS